MNKEKTVELKLKGKPLTLRTIFWGYHRSGWTTYNYLKKSQIFKLQAVVLPSNRNHETIDKLKKDALDSGFKIFEPEDLNDQEFIAEIKALVPDVYIVDSYTKLIPAKLLAVTDNLNFNLHPGALPAYRGAHVLNWSLIKGEKDTAMSLHMLSDKFDAGPVIGVKKIKIADSDTVNDIDAKMNKAIPPLLVALEKQFKQKKIIAQPQSGKVCYYRPRQPEDGRIDSSESIKTIHNKIRALTYPWPGAYLVRNNKKIIVWQAIALDLYSDFPPGELLKKGEDLFLVSADRRLLHIRCLNEPNLETYLPRTGKEIIESFAKSGIKVNDFLSPIQALDKETLSQYLKELVSLEVTIKIKMDQEYANDTWDKENFSKDFPRKWQFSQVVVSGVDKKLCGFLIASEMLAKEIHIHRLAVDPNFQGKGLGSLLLSKALATAKEYKCQQATVELSCLNVKALTFYQKFGFKHLSPAELSNYVAQRKQNVKIEAGFLVEADGSRSYVLQEPI